MEVILQVYMDYVEDYKPQWQWVRLNDQQLEIKLKERDMRKARKLLVGAYRRVFCDRFFIVSIDAVSNSTENKGENNWNKNN